MRFMRPPLKIDANRRAGRTAKSFAAENRYKERAPCNARRMVDTTHEGRDVSLWHETDMLK